MHSPITAPSASVPPSPSPSLTKGTHEVENCQVSPGMGTARRGAGDPQPGFGAALLPAQPVSPPRVPFSILEVRVLEMEAKHQAELAGLRSEKERLQVVVSRQSGTIEDLEKSLLAASANSSLLQRQQLQLLEAVQGLVRLVAQGRGESGEMMVAGLSGERQRDWEGFEGAGDPGVADARLTQG